MHARSPTSSPQLLLPFLCFCAALSAQSPSTQAPSPFVGKHELPADRAAGATAVAVEDCKKWLYTLASPEFEGRGTGEPGYLKAAEFVAAHFGKLGLEARGENGSYFQTVPWTATKIDADKTFVSFSKDGKEVLRVPAARLAGSASAQIEASGDVVLLVVAPPPAPAPAPETGGQRPGRAGRFAVPTIPGLADLDVQGKVVIAYVQTQDGGTGANAATLFGIRQGLAGKQAAALLFVQDAKPEGGLRGLSGARRSTNPAAAGRGRQPLDITFGGGDLAALLKEAGVHKNVLISTELITATALQGTVAVTMTEAPAPAMNVWAVLPGSDPRLRDEYVVIGSHLDHLGRRGDTYCPGADDDGSGTTGVMAVAQMFAKNPQRPARSILFVCFSGEEVSLNGSRFFAQNCPIPLSSIAAELQMDMIGRDEEEARDGGRLVNVGEKAEDNHQSLHLVGTQKLAPALHELCLQRNQTAGFDLEYDQESLYGRSDHVNFARMGVPIAFFFSGLHRDYHQTTDTPDKIHYEKLLRVGSYVYDIAFELATQSQRPLIDPALWQQNRGNSGPELPAAPLAEPKKGEPKKEAPKDEKKG